MAAPKVEWLPITPAELAETRSPTNPDAPAEILYRRIESDMSDAPFGSLEREYLRYKIYNPEKSDAYTRVSQFDFSDLFSSSSTNFRQEILARLTLPDGTTRLFTKADIKERPIQKSAADNSLLSRLFSQSNQVTEKFLAVTGVVPGSILEFQLTNEVSIDGDIPEFILDWAKKYYPGMTKTYALQHPDLPVRKVEFIGKNPTDTTFPCLYYTLNRSVGNATSAQDRKKGTVNIQATGLPPSLREPLAGPASYYSLTMLQCLSNANSTKTSRQGKRTNVTVDVSKDGPWSPIAAAGYVEWEDSSEVTGKVKQLAREITAKASTPEEKARLIHAHVQHMAQAYFKRPKPKGEVTAVKNMDDIVTHAQEPNRRVEANDFLFLAHALFLASGLECRGVLLPDRSRYPFSPQLVAKTFMSNWAVAVKLDGHWKYSMPQAKYAVSFDSLPWYCSQTMGLVMKPGAQELFDAPALRSADARIVNTAELTLEASGDLSGTATRTYWGHHAYEIRSRLKNRQGKAINRFFQRLLEEDFKEVTQTAEAEEVTAGETDEDGEERSRPARHVQITNIKGLADPVAPIEVAYKLRLAGYAQAAGERLLFRPSVFRSSDRHPFSETVRRTPVRLPFPWQEIDLITLHYPESLALEKLDAPKLPSGPALHYRNKAVHDAAKHTITYRREFALELTTVPVENYGMFKAWNDDVQTADQQQLVLTKAAGAATP